MAKFKACPDCGCIMKCEAWHFEEDVGDKQGAGDFDCRNCDYILNNESEDIITIRGYSSGLLDGVPEDKKMSEFRDEHEDDVVYGYDDDSDR